MRNMYFALKLPSAERKKESGRDEDAVRQSNDLVVLEKVAVDPEIAKMWMEDGCGKPC